MGPTPARGRLVIVLGLDEWEVGADAVCAFAFPDGSMEATRPVESTAGRSVERLGGGGRPGDGGKVDRETFGLAGDAELASGEDRRCGGDMAGRGRRGLTRTRGLSITRWLGAGLRLRGGNRDSSRRRRAVQAEGRSLGDVAAGGLGVGRPGEGAEEDHHVGDDATKTNARMRDRHRRGAPLDCGKPRHPKSISISRAGDVKRRRYLDLTRRECERRRGPELARDARAKTIPGAVVARPTRFQGRRAGTL